MKIVVADNHFIGGVRHAVENLIYTTLDTHERLMVVHKVIRHVQDEGAVLIFPSGNIDPTPALSPKQQMIWRIGPQHRVHIALYSPDPRPPDHRMWRAISTLALKPVHPDAGGRP